MNRLVAALTLLALVGCSQDSQHPGRAASIAGPHVQATEPAEVFGLAAAGGIAGNAYEARIRQQRTFARLPDRGELLSYQRGGPQDTRVEGAYTWHRVAISEEHALRAIADRRLRLAIPSGQTLDILYDRHIEHPSGDLSWVGHIEGEPGTQTIITFGADAVFGSIGQSGKRSLRLTTRNGSGWIVETDPARLAGIASAGANPRKPDAVAVPKMRANFADAPLVQPSSVPVPAAAAAATTIDVLVGYTQGFASAQGGTSGVMTRLNYLVTVGNEALANSQVNARIRLVHAMQVSYTDASKNESALEQLTGYDSSEERYTTPNAAFDALRKARESYGADLVTLVRDFRDPEQDGCGIAWLIGGGRSGVSPGDGQDYFGYSVVSDGYDENGGETYFCRDETLIHELAHNMGSQHDRDSARGDDGEMDADEYGAFRYSFGYKTAASAGNFYTVMAYGEEGQVDYRVFSNPRITFCGNRTCGSTTYEDNARSLGEIAPLVSGFRQMQGRYTRGDVNGDGNADLVWSRPSPSQLVYWLMDGAGILIGKSFSVNAANRTIGTGDLDGNGKLDVIRMNESTGDVFVLLGQGSSFISRSIGNRRGWRLIGTGDVNRDGRSDLLWSRQSTGQFVHWLMDGGVVTSGRSFTVNSAWRGVGVGDLNADGSADVVWKNDANGGHIYIWTGTGGGYQASASIGRRIGWSLVGAQDVNDDGNDDLIWAKRGYLVRWLMDGSDILIGRSYEVNHDWRAIGAADYNGDGHADIAWKNDFNGGHIYIWTGNGAGFKSSASIGRRIGWTLAPY